MKGTTPSIGVNHSPFLSRGEPNPAQNLYFINAWWSMSVTHAPKSFCSTPGTWKDARGRMVSNVETLRSNAIYYYLIYKPQVCSSSIE